MNRQFEPNAEQALAVSRLHDEVLELTQAVDSGEATLILDEIVDVIFFTSSIAKSFGISQTAIQQYSEAKSQLRDAGLKCEYTEIRLAHDVLQGAPS